MHGTLRNLSLHVRVIGFAVVRKDVLQVPIDVPISYSHVHVHVLHVVHVRVQCTFHEVLNTN